MFTSGLIGRPSAIVYRIEEERESVRCVNGANEQNLPIQGKSVSWARSNLGPALNVAPGAVALLDGEPVGEEHVLVAGEFLEFLVVRGRKGLGEVFTGEELVERLKITAADLDDMIAAGLPVHRYRDGTLRIIEDQLDRFLDCQAGADVSSGGRDCLESAPSTGSSPLEEPSMMTLVRGFDERLAAIQVNLSALVLQRAVKDFYSTEDVAKIVDRDAYTVREWCRYGRLRAVKRSCGRGKSPEWSIPHEELVRYQNEGLLPLRK
jgi:hypothetical protein